MLLIVEDDRDIRMDLADFLDSEGFQVLQAVNGREALEVLRNSNPIPDLILLDLMMPEMNGETFRREQLKDPRIKGIPTIVISADLFAFPTMRELGVQHCLRKPIDLDRLMALIQAPADPLNV